MCVCSSINQDCCFFQSKMRCKLLAHRCRSPNGPILFELLLVGNFSSSFRNTLHFQENLCRFVLSTIIVFLAHSSVAISIGAYYQCRHRDVRSLLCARSSNSVVCLVPTCAIYVFVSRRSTHLVWRLSGTVQEENFQKCLASYRL